MRRDRGLRQMLQGLADAFVIALAMIAAAEVFIEETSERPQIFSTVLTAHYPSPFLGAVFII
jgi:hypothetical protein